jgi:predicted nucleic acid-binding protein
LTTNSFEEGLSAYDATYLLLAQKLGCPLATLDKNLRRAAKSVALKLPELKKRHCLVRLSAVILRF